jgi:hypothetical protein
LHVVPINSGGVAKAASGRAGRFWRAKMMPAAATNLAAEAKLGLYFFEQARWSRVMAAPWAPIDASTVSKPRPHNWSGHFSDDKWLLARSLRAAAAMDIFLWSAKIRFCLALAADQNFERKH